MYHSKEAEKEFTSFLKSMSYEKGGQGPRIKKTLNLSQVAGKNEATLDSKKRGERSRVRQTERRHLKPPLEVIYPSQPWGQGAA